MENLTSQNLDFKGMKPVKQVKVCYLNISQISPSGSFSANLFNADFYDLNYPLKTLKIHLNLSMSPNITAVCPCLPAPLTRLSLKWKLQRGERGEHKFNCSETAEFLFIFIMQIIGGESINMKHSRWGIEYICKKCEKEM